MWWFTLALVTVLALAAPAGVAAQQSDQPVVYGILLYSPSCPACHYFIESEWPSMHEEFGDQFLLLFVNVASQGGRDLAQAAYQLYQIPDDQRYVPMMFIGERVFVGATDIPALAPDVIREGLASGGIDLPPVPGLREAYEQALAQAETQAEEAPAEPEAAAAEEAAGVAEPSQPDPPAPEAPPLLDPSAAAGADTLGTRLARDPVANALAIAVLLGLTASLGAVVVTGARGMSTQSGDALAWLAGRPGHWAALVVALAGLAIALTLLAQTGGDPLAMLLAAIAVVCLAAAAFAIYSHGLRGGQNESAGNRPGWLVPAVLVAGLTVAIYLAAVEVGQEQAVCGLVGDCNLVQQSPYAKLFGVIPVGVLGVVGFVAILAAWAVTRLGSGQLADLAHVLGLGMALFGTAFSIYLTFLEPFVIGATCAWCLTSALIMLLLLWLLAPGGLQAARRMLAR